MLFSVVLLYDARINNSSVKEKKRRKKEKFICERHKAEKMNMESSNAYNCRNLRRKASSRIGEKMEKKILAAVVTEEGTDRKETTLAAAD